MRKLLHNDVHICQRIFPGIVPRIDETIQKQFYEDTLRAFCYRPVSQVLCSMKASIYVRFVQ